MRKKRTPSYFLSIISLILGLLLMQFLRRVYFVGLIILFIIIVFQTPSPKVDQTGESSEIAMNLLKFIGLNTILYLIGGYAALFLF